jgi:hypothetical protein
MENVGKFADIESRARAEQTGARVVQRGRYVQEPNHVVTTKHSILSISRMKAKTTDKWLLGW